MSDLEEMGFLEKPHTSAGRVPTDRGYRFYVDTIKDIPHLSPAELESIDQHYSEKAVETIELMEVTSKILSSLSRHAGIVFYPKIVNSTLTHIKFIKLLPQQALAVLVTTPGLVHNKIIELGEDLSQEKLDEITKYLNKEFAGLTLRTIRERIFKKMQEEKEHYDRLLRRALRLSEKTFAASETGGDVYVGGAVNILDQPEFAGDVEKMKAIFRAFEEKSRLVEILDRCLAEDRNYILIGAECQVEEMQDCSLVTHTYTSKEGVVGTLGIVGPKRMEYPRIIAIVDHTAKAISRVLTRPSSLS